MTPEEQNGFIGLDFDEIPYFGSCARCGVDLDEDDIDELCDQCRWWIHEGSTQDE